MRLIHRSAALAIVVALALAQPVAADIVGFPAAPAPLTAAQAAVVEANPDLKGLSDSAPWLLRSVLAKIETPTAPNGTSKSGLDDLNSTDLEILERNPALLQVWNASPEAAAELLALIKAAGGKQGK